MDNRRRVARYILITRIARDPAGLGTGNSADSSSTTHEELSSHVNIETAESCQNASAVYVNDPVSSSSSGGGSSSSNNTNTNNKYSMLARTHLSAASIQVSWPAERHSDFLS